MTLAKPILIQRIRWHLGDRPWETTGSTDADIPTVLVEDSGEWAKGDIGEFEEDGDAFRVREPSGTSNELTTTRSYYGSAAAGHIIGSRIFKNPKFHYSEISSAISEVIEFMLPWPRFYKVVPITITPDVDTVWYNLEYNAQALVRVNQLYGDASERNKRYGQRHEYITAKLKRGLPTTLVASGVGMEFPGGFLHETNDVEVEYATKITDAETSGFYNDLTAGEALTSAVEYGAVSLLLGGLEIRKPRHAADEIDNFRGMSVFERLFQRAVRTAEKELRQNSPLMQGWDKP